ncbi:HEAT repeat domain-containing protein [Chamaesiphon sp. VAR_69_metabat_338]|uniref:HEAT repeat domain-containing protein n=1 Tax=Chamaesiphon sp. VAR_69_metabat_338 TaxID=2964704 RepID=UPI00286E2C39|nr:HEAT repeat domain-containing protein [Chamaesiphon sp. VAR_69_metabat_338]
MDNLDNLAKKLEIGLDSRSTAELIQLALSAPEEDDDYSNERWHFVGLLQRRGDREVLDRALGLTESISIEERSLGIDILGQLGIPERTFPDECVMKLIELLNREFDPLILRDICIALGHLNDPRSIEPQLKFCFHPDWEVRYGVVSGLSGKEDERAISGLIKLSADVCPHIRDWATFGLGTLIEVDTPAIRDALYQRFLLEDSQDEETAEIYDEALAGLANRQDDRILPRLIAQLMSDDVGKLAIQAAEAMADDRLYPALLHLQTWWEPTCIYLEDALLACKPQ